MTHLAKSTWNCTATNIVQSIKCARNQFIVFIMNGRLGCWTKSFSKWQKCSYVTSIDTFWNRLQTHRFLPRKRGSSVLNVHMNEAFDITQDTTTFHSFHFMSAFFRLPFLIAIFFHADFVNLATVSRYLPRPRAVWALRRFQVPAGRGLLGNIIWLAQHVGFVHPTRSNSSS